MYVERRIDGTMDVYAAVNTWLGRIEHDHKGYFAVDQHGDTHAVATERDGIDLLMAQPSEEE